MGIEWLVEEIDEFGDIIEVNHWHDIAGVRRYLASSLDDGIARRDWGLVRDSADDRAWAYVKDGKLPEWFEDASGRRVARVPAKYHMMMA